MLFRFFALILFSTISLNVNAETLVCSFTDKDNCTSRNEDGYCPKALIIEDQLWAIMTLEADDPDLAPLDVELYVYVLKGGQMVASEKIKTKNAKLILGRHSISLRPSDKLNVYGGTLTFDKNMTSNIICY